MQFGGYSEVSHHHLIVHIHQHLTVDLLSLKYLCILLHTNSIQQFEDLRRGEEGGREGRGGEGGGGGGGGRGRGERGGGGGGGR